MNLFLPQDGGGNPRSRFATLSMMTEAHTFRIDDTVRRRWSWDWSYGADRHLYSNKAPGPMLFGFPIYAAVDRFVTRGARDLDERQTARRAHEGTYGVVLSLLLQVLPFALAVALGADFLVRRGAGRAAVHFFALAALFGNTVAVLMNTYFGHGMSATFLLLAALWLLEDGFFGTGLFYGLALLSEYAAAFAALPLAAALFVRVRFRRQAWVPFAIGGLAPAVLWSAYHTICFGSPFRTALQSLNPMFVTDPTLLGVPVSTGENLRIVKELLFGPSRGLLFTQPWLLVVLVALPLVLRGRERTDPAVGAAVLAGGTLLGLLFMCSRHPSGWHSGWSSGPRYLCVIFPVFALLAGLVLDGLPRALRAAAWAGLVASVALGVLILSTTILSPTFLPLWPTLAERLFAPGADLARARFGLAALAMLLAAARLVREPEAGVLKGD